MPENELSVPSATTEDDGSSGEDIIEPAILGGSTIFNSYHIRRRTLRLFADQSAFGWLNFDLEFIKG